MGILLGRVTLSPGEGAAWATLLATLITSIAGAIATVINAVRVKEVKRQVETTNGKTLAEVAEDNHQAVQEKLVPVAELVEQATPLVQELVTDTHKIVSKNDNERNDH